MNQTLARFRLAEDATIVGNLCRDDVGQFASCEFNAVAKSTERAKAVIDKEAFDWKKGDLAGLKARVEKVQGAKGKTDLCLVNPPLCDDSLGIERKDMPQFPKEAVEAFVKGLGEHGVKIEQMDVPVSELKATQNEINATKVLGMAEKMAAGGKLGGGDVFVSSDNFVLDGHHRWAATWINDQNATLKVTKIDMPIRKLLQVADKYSAQKKNFWESNNLLFVACKQTFGDGDGVVTGAFESLFVKSLLA